MFPSKSEVEMSFFPLPKDNWEDKIIESSQGKKKGKNEREPLIYQLKDFNG
mgnify:CR=1 FL=1